MKRNQKSRRLAMRIRERGAPMKSQVYIRDHGCCHYCAIELRITDATIDHVLPVARGGQTTLDNTVLACVECNHAKGTRTKEEFTAYWRSKI